MRAPARVCAHRRPLWRATARTPLSGTPPWLRFVVRETVEERMLTLQSRKRSMVEDALGTSKEDERKSRLQDLRKLFA